MTDANRNLLVRILSSVVLIPAVLLALWFGTLPTALALAFAAAAMSTEFSRIALKKLDAGQLLGIAAAALPALGFVLWPERVWMFVSVEAVVLLIALFVCYLLTGPLPEAPQRIALVFTGFFYTGVLPSAVVGLRERPEGFAWVVLLMLLTWGNDTGAYAFGRLFGRHKLYPAVSPAKTWEGFFGGALVTLAIAFIASATFLPQLRWVDALALGIPAALLGPLGDLCESMFKRAYGVKDSGKIIPGHGGMLDRLDALLFNAPYVYFYVSHVMAA